MENRQQEMKSKRSDVIVTIAFAFAIAAVVISTKFFSAITAIVYPAVAILMIVRWINSRDNPEATKPPRDCP
jgi:hypothetical protein